jgi:outer membrane protein OmpA-like peptidoglycan-associated protein
VGLITVDGAQIRRHPGALVTAAVAGLALTFTACGGGDDDAGADDQAAVDDREAGEAQATTDGSDTSGDAGSPVSDSAAGPGSDLSRESTDASSDLEREVTEALSDLDVETRDGDTVITVPDRVLFAFDEHELLPEAIPVLDDLVQAIDHFADAPVQVHGHTDAIGSDASNQTLSEQRAQAVVDHFTNAGIDPSRLHAQGFGESQPVAPNTYPDGSDNPDGRAQNRRVEIIIEGVDVSNR